MNKAICDHFNINHFYIHEGPVFNTLILDKIGEMGVSSICTDPNTFNSLSIDPNDREKAISIIENISKNDLDRKKQTEKGSVTRIVNQLKSRYSAIIFYSGVNDWNTGILPRTEEESYIHSPYFSGTQDALLHLLEIAERNNWLVLFKPHPNIKFSEDTPKSENLIVLHNANASECIRVSDITVTLVSSLAYNAMNLKKPVVMLGKIQLQVSNSIYFPKNKDNIEKTVVNALNLKDYDEIYNNYLNHITRLMKYYLIPYHEEKSSIFLSRNEIIKEFLSCEQNQNWEQGINNLI